MREWIKNHFNKLNTLLLDTVVVDSHKKNITMDEGFKQYAHCLRAARFAGNKLIFIGNGGSAGIASHLAIDYTKHCGFRAITFNDISALTCLSNDYGYENVFSKQIEFHANKGDVLIAISSSGQSKNILNAVLAAKKIQCAVMTFSGFEPNNALSCVGDLNFYVKSNDYGLVEVAHLALGHAILSYMETQEDKVKEHEQAI